ncbi:MAG TPA: hypothetical protein G4N93_00135 [Dehalococcoidia bacterium]|nr:hypothetical protein [Dehalococcoidia bacterium]
MKGKILSGKLFSAIAAIILVSVIATPVLASPATATRTLPASVASGAEFDVAIEASGCGTFGQVVETLPSGFVYVSSSLPAKRVEPVGNMVKFTFLADAKSFTYRVKAPTVDTTTVCTFHGVVMDEDRISYPIEDSEVIVCMKGDFDGDGHIDIFDFVAFADAYGSELGDPNYNAIGDFNNDGQVDIFDFVDFADGYGT